MALTGEGGFSIVRRANQPRPGRRNDIVLMPHLVDHERHRRSATHSSNRYSMKILVSGKQVDLGDALRSHVTDRLNAAIKKYIEDAVSGSVVFSREGTMFRCNCSVHVGTNIDMQADADDPEIYASFDKALEKLEKQVRRDKRKRRNHHSSKPDIEPIS